MAAQAEIRSVTRTRTARPAALILAALLALVSSGCAGRTTVIADAGYIRTSTSFNAAQGTVRDTLVSLGWSVTGDATRSYNISRSRMTTFPSSMPGGGITYPETRNYACTCATIEAVTVNGSNAWFGIFAERGELLRIVVRVREGAEKDTREVTAELARRLGLEQTR